MPHAKTIRRVLNLDATSRKICAEARTTPREGVAIFVMTTGILSPNATVRVMCDYAWAQSL